MTGFRTPNFRGWHALIAHRSGQTTERLVRQLERIGLTSEIRWPEIEALETRPDVIFFDGDNAFDGVFPWKAGEAPAPMIALLSTEAPGRLEWSIQQGVNANLLKPLGSSGVFSTLVLAVSAFERQAAMRQEIAAMRNRARLQPVIFRATVMVMKQYDLDEEAAFAFLRSEAMRRRQSLEGFSNGLCGGRIDLPPDKNHPQGARLRRS